MRIVYFLLLLGVFAGLSACAAGAAPATAAPTEMAPTAPPPATAAARLPTRACELPRQQPLGLGFPVAAERLPAAGTVRVTVLFADFPDAPAARSPQAVLAMLSPQAEAFFAAQSGGRLQVELAAHLEWLRLSQPAAAYGLALSDFYAHREFVQEAVDLADGEVDFSASDLVVLLANPDATEIPYGPTLMGSPGEGLEADGAVIANGITSGNDLLHWGFLWLNHEMGHSLGLPDLYAYEYAPELGQFPYTGGFSLMGNIFGAAPELTAIERWMLGWLAPEQIHCLRRGAEVELDLEAIASGGPGPKAVAVPLSDYELLLVEVRKALGYDQGLEQPGTLVYVVDTRADSGYGPLRVLFPEGRAVDQALLQAGEWLEYAGVEIAVLSSGDAVDRVVVRAQP